MPKRGRASLAEQAEDAQRRSRELRLKADCQELKELIRLRPQVAALCLQHLETLGYRHADGPVVQEPSSKATQALKRRDEEAKAAKEAPHPSVANLPEADGEEMLPTTYGTLGSLSVKLLSEKVLGQIEPSIFSKSNLRSMAIRGESAGTKAALSRIIEYLTGFPGDFNLTGRWRIWRILIEELREKNRQLGRRAVDMGLPPVWSDDGIYNVWVSKGVVTLKHGFTRVQESITSLLPEGCETRDLFVDYNWSEERAMISSRSGRFKPLSCMTSLAAARARDRPLMRNASNPLALCDGRLATPSPQKSLTLGLASGEGAGNLSAESAGSQPQASEQSLGVSEQGLSAPSTPSRGAVVDSSACDETEEVPPEPEDSKNLSLGRTS